MLVSAPSPPPQQSPPSFPQGILARLALQKNARREVAERNLFTIGITHTGIHICIHISGHAHTDTEDEAESNIHQLAAPTLR